MARKKKKKSVSPQRRLALKMIARYEELQVSQMDPSDMVTALVDAKLESLASVSDADLERMAENTLDDMASLLE